MVVDHISTLADAEEAVFINDYGAILLDRQLPDGDGLTLIPKLRARGAGVPVIVLTARGELADRIAGLDTGADDYHGKPFAVEELLARLRAVLRRPADLPPKPCSLAGCRSTSATAKPASPASRSICRAADFWCWKRCCAGWGARSRVRR
jgi:two-component system OmpR family response regulator